MGVTAENVHAVGAVEIFGSERLGRGTANDKLAVEKEDLVEKRLDAFEVVMRGDHQLTGIAETAHRGSESLGGIPVEPCERLVEEVDFRTLRPSAGQECALLLASGKGGYLPVGEILEVANMKGLIHSLTIFGAEPPPVAERRITPHFHKPANRDRKIPVHRFALRHIGDRARGMIAKLVASKRMCPVSIGSRPAMALRSVVFPAPLGPSSATHEPQRNEALKW